MLIALFIGLFLITVVAHEAAHAIYFLHAGVEIREMGFGLPAGPSLSYNPKWLPFKLRFWLLPLMAYVRPEDGEAAKALAYGQFVHAVSAGIMTNWCLGWLYIAAAEMAAFALWHQRLGIRLMIASASLAIVGLSIRFFRQLTERTLGYVSMSLLFLLPLEVLTVGAWGFPFSVSHLTIPAAIFIAGVASLDLALFNLSPFSLFDGGKLVERWAGARWSESGRDQTLATLRSVLAPVFFILCLTHGPLIMGR